MKLFFNVEGLVGYNGKRAEFSGGCPAQESTAAEKDDYAVSVDLDDTSCGIVYSTFGRISALNSQIEETQDSQQQLLQQIAAAVAQQEQITATMAQQTPLLDRKEIVVSAPVAGADVQNGDMAVVEPEAAHKVYLTFDDGPSKYTEEILDILDDYDVKATFFVLGKETEYSVKMLQEIARRGHTIGMHSYSHKYADVYRSVEDFSADFYRIYSYILENTGIQSTCYRFPGEAPIP